jgi:ribulose-phosphate 3-epimerase
VSGDTPAPGSARARAILAATRVAPSILSADFGRLREQVGEVLAAGARVIHVDVMDGHFVPPITIGPLVAGALADQVHDAGGMLDVHLMIERPERHAAEFVAAGADSITFHAEATPNVAYTADLIRSGGAGAGVAINPATSSEALRDLGGEIGVALCMTVNPGWGGQSFIEHSLDKIPRVRTVVGDDVAVEVDGGIDPETAPRCAAAGANVFVAGSAIFTSGDPAAAYSAIVASIDAA